MIHYTKDDLKDPTFVGIYCETCNAEIGYDNCTTCKEEQE